MNCIYCGKPTSDGSDEHEACFQLSAEEAIGADECPMCGWERGTNPTSCGECAIEADDSVGVGHDDEWDA